jgi:cell division protease FtsH
LDYGMSSLGPINWGPKMDEGGRFYEPLQVSQSMQEKIDVEVRKIMDDCYKQALKLIKTYRKPLDAVSLELLKVETLDRDEFEKLVGDKPKAKLAFASIRT